MFGSVYVWFCNVWVFVCIGFLICGVCVYKGFVMCGCVYVGVRMVFNVWVFICFGF
jgi:hypothetical protein